MKKNNILKNFIIIIFLQLVNNLNNFVEIWFRSNMLENLFWINLVLLLYISQLIMNFYEILFVIFIIIIIYLDENLHLYNFWVESIFIIHFYLIVYLWAIIGIKIINIYESIWIIFFLFINNLYNWIMFIIIGFLWLYSVFSLNMWWNNIDKLEICFFFVILLNFKSYHINLIYFYENYLLVGILYLNITLWYSYNIRENLIHQNLDYYEVNSIYEFFIGLLIVYIIILYKLKLMYKNQYRFYLERNSMIYLIIIIYIFIILKLIYIYINEIITTYLIWVWNILKNYNWFLIFYIYIINYFYIVNIDLMICIIFIQNCVWIYTHYQFIYIWWVYIDEIIEKYINYKYLKNYNWWFYLIIVIGNIFSYQKLRINKKNNWKWYSLKKKTLDS